MTEADPPLLFGRFTPRVSRPSLRAAAHQLQQAVAQGRAFTCLLTNDRQLRRLNRDFLGKDYPTDVLSFPSGTDDPLGELAISVNRAAAQAAAFGHTIEEEIQVLMLHGLLHLLGMDHENDRGQMARAETHWHRKLGYPAGLLQRGRA